MRRGEGKTNAVGYQLPFCIGALKFISTEKPFAIRNSCPSRDTYPPFPALSARRCQALGA